MRDAKQYGAKGDGVTKDTAAIQAALDAGGMVRLTPGTYVSGTLYLRSHGGLHLEPGAVLKASPDPEDYNAADFCPQNRASKAEVASGGHLIVALERDDVTLSGGGVIHGNSQAFLNERDPNIPVWYKRIWRPSQMLYFCECTNVRITGLTLRDSPYWHCFLYGCEFVLVDGLNIQGETAVPNNDGIDVDCCRFVTVSHCVIASGDDSLTIRCDSAKLKHPKPAENIVISDCVLRSGYANAIRIGVGSGEVRNCRFQNIVIDHTRSAVNVVSKYTDNEVPGGYLHDISFSGFQVDCERLCVLKLDNNPAHHYPSDRTISNLTFSDISGTVCLSAQIHGNDSGTLEGILFRGIALNVHGSGAQPNRNRDGWWGRSSTHAGFDIRKAARIAFSDCILRFNEHPGWKYGIETTGSKDISVSTSCHFNRPNALEQE